MKIKNFFRIVRLKGVMDLWPNTEKESAKWTVHERAEKDWLERPGRPGAWAFTEDKGGVSFKKDETAPRSKAVGRHCEFGINLCSWDLINWWTFVCHNKGSFSERTWLGALRVGQSLRVIGWGWIADEMEALHLLSQEVSLRSRGEQIERVKEGIFRMRKGWVYSLT